MLAASQDGKHLDKYKLLAVYFEWGIVRVKSSDDNNLLVFIFEGSFDIQHADRQTAAVLKITVP